MIDLHPETIIAKYKNRWLLFMTIAFLYFFSICQQSIAQEAYRFRIAAKFDSERVAYSNEVTAEPVFTLYIPEAFTPNGDGLNDVFKVVSLEHDQYHMTIFDRWGNNVFESYQIEQGWDGRKGGILVPIGAYVYQLSITTKSGLVWSKTGQVILAKH